MNKSFGKIGFIGGGKMAQAIIKGIISSKFFKASDIFVSEPNLNVAEKISQEFGIKVYSTNKELAKNSDIIVFAVKPFIVQDIINDIKNHIDNKKIIISILAGISTNYIQSELNIDVPVIRVMPNTPALVNEGMSAVCKGSMATNSHLNFAKDLFKCLGKVIQVEEGQIDIVTAISGSSPAFYYYFIDEIAKSAQKMGFDYNIALLAAAQSALGSAKMILETGISPEVLIENVTTKGGTTEVGMNILKAKHLDKIVDEAIVGTKEKAEKLGK